MHRCAYDVCVCGGGPAGFIAAIAAARIGARTVLLEKNGYPGGMATAGLVGPISKFNFAGCRVVGGIPLEFIERMHARGGSIIDLPSGNIPFDAEIYKLVAQEMLLESGVAVIFHATAYGVEFAGDNRIAKVLSISEGSAIAAEAAAFIDATGTGSIIAGRRDLWRKRNSVAANQPLSLIFKLGGVATGDTVVLMGEDNVRYAHPGLRRELTAAVERKLISGFGGPWAVWGSVIRDGMVSVNCTRYGGDAIDPIDFSQAEIDMRREIMPIIDIFRRADPAFADCFLLETASTAGYRESRELVGMYRMAADDIFSQRAFPDTIAFGAHPIDRHLPAGSGQQVRFLSAPYPIPYRCMVSESCPNLLAAGALISAEPEAFASTRVQAQCMALGQAAGTAAALCAASAIPMAELDPGRLRSVLIGHKALV